MERNPSWVRTLKDEFWEPEKQQNCQNYFQSPVTLQSFWYRGEETAILCNRCNKTTTFCRDVLTTAIILSLPHFLRHLRICIINEEQWSFPPGHWTMICQFSEHARFQECIWKITGAQVLGKRRLLCLQLLLNLKNVCRRHPESPPADAPSQYLLSRAWPGNEASWAAKRCLLRERSTLSSQKGY